MGAVNAGKIRSVMFERGYSQHDVVDMINKKFPGSNIKRHDINNILTNNYSGITHKTQRKLEMIAEVLNQPVDIFLSASSQGDTVEVAQDLRYDGTIYRDSSIVVEKLLESYSVPASLEVIQEYTKSTHDYAVKEGFSDPAMLKIYADGIIQGAIKAGILFPESK